ncbi:MAG TPA: hypothetical protein VNQ99_15115 [Xanthobacteraceae bacterium]|nr:hypothetical protein [Xanthobacteraceae bacterium]
MAKKAVKRSAKKISKRAVKKAVKQTTKKAAKALRTTAKKAVKATAKKSASKRRPWTKEDIRDLKQMARQKTPAPQIARKLKRSEGATRQQAFKLGVSLDSRG